MCPCVLLDKLKKVFGKKQKKAEKTEKTEKTESSEEREEKPPAKKPVAPKAPESASQSSGTASPSGGSTQSKPSSGQNKKEERSKSEKKEKREEPCSSKSGNSSKIRELEANQQKHVLVGQPVCLKPHPKDYLRKILSSERPDLVKDEQKLRDLDLIALETHLLVKGEMRGGISLTLGEVTGLDSSVGIGNGNKVTVVMLYAHGRFGSVYMINKEQSRDEIMKKLPSMMAMKTSRRMYCPSRIEYEIKILTHLYSKEVSKKETRTKTCETTMASKEKSRLPTHITPILYHGTSGGTSFMFSPIMDASLEKLRQELKGFPKGDAFYLGQEAMVGLKECHERNIIHRDFKPTNILLGCGDNNRSWWLCDFGDACRTDEARILSFPDNMTLPYLSRPAHKALTELIPADIWWDLESWFYFLLEFFIPLPWKDLTEEAETLTAKIVFWTSLDDFLQKNAETLPPQVGELALRIAEADPDGIHSKLTKILKDGFQKNIQTPWQPVWLTMRAQKTAEGPPDAAPKPAPEAGPRKGPKMKTEETLAATQHSEEHNSGSLKKKKSKSKSRKSKSEKSKRTRTKTMEI